MSGKQSAKVNENMKKVILADLPRIKLPMMLGGWNIQ
jgi:hypothetical protein